MNVLLIIFIGIIGLVFGSFMNVLIMRVPKNISIVKPSSFCPQCMENISWKEDIRILCGTSLAWMVRIQCMSTEFIDCIHIYQIF